MSSVASAPSATPSTSSCSLADFTHFPTSDAACAITSTSGVPSNTSSILSACCNSAPVEDFNGASCGYYCLSIDQSVRELQTCFMEKGARPADIQCNANNTATATGKPSSSASRTGGADGAKETGAKSAATRGVSKMGLGMLGVVVASIVMGAVV